MKENFFQNDGVEFFYSNLIDDVNSVTAKLNEADIDFLVIKNNGTNIIYGTKVTQEIEKALFKYSIFVHERDRETAEKLLDEIEKESEKNDFEEYDYNKTIEKYKELGPYFQVKFAHFDDPANTSEASWNWCAWLFPLVWLLAKKLWGAFFLNLLITIVLFFAFKDAPARIGNLFTSIQCIICGVYGNYWYYLNYKSKHITEEKWKCPYCGTLNSRRKISCSKCDAVQD